MQRNEQIVAIVPAVGLREPRSIRTTHGVYGGPSIRVSRRTSIHGGGFRSTSSSHEELKDIDGGDLIITNQRLFFAGKKRTSNVPFKKIVSIEPYQNSLVLHKDGKERAQYFLWPENLIKIKEEGYSEPLTGFSIQALIEKQIT